MKPLNIFQMLKGLEDEFYLVKETVNTSFQTALHFLQEEVLIVNNHLGIDPVYLKFIREVVDEPYDVWCRSFIFQLPRDILEWRYLYFP